MSRNPLSLVLVLHAHQPISNPDSIVQEVIDRCYRPVLTTLARHSKLPWVLHVSGSLLQRWQSLAPDLLDLVKSGVKRGLIELLGGGWHEPLLPFIPSVDRQGQFKELARRLKSLFGASPHGVWLAERVWEPSFPVDLVSAGAAYTLLDEHAFLQTGWAEHQLTGPFLTEDQGSEIGIFPISRALRYLIPFAEHDVLMGSLYERAHRNGGVWVYADDIEKMGAWPGTYERMHEQGWLENFCELLTASTAWLRVERLDTIWARREFAGPAYLPATSYPEFLRWSLPPYLRGRPGTSGSPRHFLVRYPEVRLLQRRMLAASRAVHARPRPSAARLDQLWQSQTSCAYWHGWFGGAYDPVLRQSARMAAARAEHEALAPEGIAISREDVDGCGEAELIVHTPAQWLAVQPADGAVLGWEAARTGFDLFGVMHAWEEEGRIETEDALPTHLKPLAAFFLPARFSGIPFRGDSDARVIPMVLQAEHPSTSQDASNARIELVWALKLRLSEGEIPLRLRKEVKIADKGCRFEVNWHLTNESEAPIETALGFWLPVSVHPSRPDWVPEPGFPELGVESVDDQIEGEAIGIQELQVGIPGAETLLIRAEQPYTAWYQPMIQRLMVEGSERRLLQGLSLIITTYLYLEPKTEISFGFEFSRSVGTRDD